MKQRLLILAAAVVALGFLSGPVQAHHGGAAFDQSQSLTFSGTVTQLEFANPHVLVYFDVVRMAPRRSGRAGSRRRTNSPERAGRSGRWSPVTRSRLPVRRTRAAATFCRSGSSRDLTARNCRCPRTR